MTGYPQILNPSLVEALADQGIQPLLARVSDDASALVGTTVYEIAANDADGSSCTLYVNDAGEIEWDVSGFPPDFERWARKTIGLTRDKLHRQILLEALGDDVRDVAPDRIENER